MSPTRVIGAVLLVLGLVLTAAPSIVHDPGPAADTFAAIERRIPYGGVAGFGALLLTRTSLRPYRATLAAFIFWVTLGLLVARLAGLVLDGADSQQQWMWVAVEVVVVMAAGAFLRRNARAAVPEAPVGPPGDAPD